MLILMMIAGMIIGWLIPEWVRALSPHAPDVEIPVAHNLASMTAFGIIFVFIAS